MQRRSRAKNFLALILSLAMIMSVFSALAFNTTAQVIGSNTEDTDMIAETSLNGINFINFSNYVKKYGEETVTLGFYKAEAENIRRMRELYGADEIITNEQEDSGESTELFDKLCNGVFLGFEVIGVSDVPPDDTGFSIQLKNESFASPTNILATDHREQGERRFEIGDESTSSLLTNYIADYGNPLSHRVYYSNNNPGNLNGLLEANAGSYAYK